MNYFNLTNIVKINNKMRNSEKVVSTFYNRVAHHLTWFGEWSYLNTDMDFDLDEALDKTTAGVLVRPYFGSLYSIWQPSVKQFGSKSVDFICDSKPGVFANPDHPNLFVVKCRGKFGCLEQHTVLMDQTWSGSLLYSPWLISLMHELLSPFLEDFCSACGFNQTDRISKCHRMLGSWFSHFIKLENIVRIRDIDIPMLNIYNESCFVMFREGAYAFAHYLTELAAFFMTFVKGNRFQTTHGALCSLAKSILENINAFSPKPF